MSVASSVPVNGAAPAFARAIRQAMDRYPDFYVRGARLSQVLVTPREDVKQQIAMYEHGTRNLYVYPGVGSMLQKAMGHELAHACDDNFGFPHFFSSTPEWLKIHADATYFDIDKYRDEPLEYFADMLTKWFLLGPQKLATTNPNEVTFMSTFVLPALQKTF